MRALHPVLGGSPFHVHAATARPARCGQGYVRVSYSRRRFDEVRAEEHDKICRVLMSYPADRVAATQIYSVVQVLKEHRVDDEIARLDRGPDLFDPDLMSESYEMPARGKTDTSWQAAAAIAPKAGAIRATVLDWIKKAGANGLTTDEVTAIVGIDRGTVQPRTSELKVGGHIRDSGIRRKNDNGKKAIVWIAV